MTGTAFKVIRPRKCAPAKPKVRAPKPEARVVEHVRYGLGKVLGVRQLDNGDDAVQVEFNDGITRTIRLDQTFWVTSIRSLLPPKPRRAAKPKPEPAENDVSTATGNDLEAGDDGQPNAGEAWLADNAPPDGSWSLDWHAVEEAEPCASPAMAA